MKRIIYFLMVAAMLVNLTACGSGKSSDQTSDRQPETENIAEVKKDTNNNNEMNSGNSHVLIVYFSVPEDVSTEGVDAIAGASIVVDDDVVKGNTEYIAQIVQETIGGDVFQIETTEKYPLEHDTLVDQAADEQDESKRPELSTHVQNFEQYETIILAFPNWWADLPMPVYSFLEEYDFGEKTIIPIVTHGGSGFSNTVQTISQLKPGAIVRDNGLSIARGDVASGRDATVAWAEGLNLEIRQ